MLEVFNCLYRLSDVDEAASQHCAITDHAWTSTVELVRKYNVYSIRVIITTTTSDRTNNYSRKRVHNSELRVLLLVSVCECGKDYYTRLMEVSQRQYIQTSGESCGRRRGPRRAGLPTMCASRSFPLVKNVTQLAAIQPTYESRTVAFSRNVSWAALGFLTHSCPDTALRDFVSCPLHSRVDRSPMHRNSTGVY